MFKPTFSKVELRRLPDLKLRDIVLIIGYTINNRVPIIAGVIYK
ncbi:hypothetical protein QEW_4037 [Clostridioides difficile CD160]|nr:hypothetical protein QEW_4037 [Clostridioides difficile CD160]